MSQMSRLATPVGILVLSVLAGCASATTANGGNGATEDLGTEASALVEAAVEADDTDKDAEDGIETPLSGVTDTAAGDVSVDDDKEGASGKAEKNGRGFFRPAGCLKSTREGAVVTHVFDNCTGPRGLLSMTGTVVSTWSKGPGSLSVEHKTTGFKVNGATITQTVTISHAMAGGVLTRTRTGTMTGTTAKGRTIEHKVNFKGGQCCIYVHLPQNHLHSVDNFSLTK